MVKSDGDADLIIVQKALEAAKRQDTVVVGEDRDLLVFLCYHANFEGHNIYFKYEKRQNAAQKYGTSKALQEILEVTTINTFFLYMPYLDVIQLQLVYLG